jgi:hypothetical protein
MITGKQQGSFLFEQKRFIDQDPAAKDTDRQAGDDLQELVQTVRLGENNPLCQKNPEKFA